MFQEEMNAIGNLEKNVQEGFKQMNYKIESTQQQLDLIKELILNSTIKPKV